MPRARLRTAELCEAELPSALLLRPKLRLPPTTTTGSDADSDYMDEDGIGLNDYGEFGHRDD